MVRGHGVSGRRVGSSGKTGGKGGVGAEEADAPQARSQVAASRGRDCYAGDIRRVHRGLQIRRVGSQRFTSGNRRRHEGWYTYRSGNGQSRRWINRSQ